MDAVEERVLSKELVVKILSDVVAKENVIDPTYEVSSGSGKGDGYLSFITRVDVKGKNKSLPVIIKHAHKNEKMRELMPVTKVFGTEIRVYKEVMPIFEEFQKEKNVKYPFKATPKCYKTESAANQELLVLENIRERGFKVFDKTKQMDDSHVRLVMKEYGKLHALSLAMKDQEKDKFEALATKMENPFSEEDFKKDLIDMHAYGIEKIMLVFGKASDAGIYNALAKLKENLLDFMMLINKYKGDYPVITHGDCWCNNMMFKYQEESTEPSELCLFDFQISSYTSPALDLTYFFYASASKEMLDNMDTYLKTYHDSVRAHLLEMGSDVDELLPFSALQEEWKVFAKYGFIIACVIFRVMLRDQEEIRDFTDTTNNGISTIDTFMAQSKNEDLINERYKRLTIHLYDRGFL